MSLRLRLALALLALSALPLAGLALFSYSSSSRALRSAAEQEATGLAQDLAERVGTAADEVDARIRALARLPPETWNAELAAPGSSGGAPVGSALSDLSPTLPFIEGISFVPEAPVAPAAVGEVAATAPTPRTPRVSEVAPASGVAAAPRPPSAPEPEAVRVGSLTRAESELERTESRLERARAAEGHRAEIRRELERVRIEIAAAMEQAQQAASERQKREGTAGQIGAAAETAGLHLAQSLTESLFLSAADLAQAAQALETAKAAGAAEPAAAPQPVVAGATDSAPAAAPAPEPVEEVRVPGAFRDSVSARVASGDRVVGEIQAKIRAKELLRSVLDRTDRARGEIPFALDSEGQLYVSRPDDAERLEPIPAIVALRSGADATPSPADGEWVVAARRDPATGYRYGIARPLSSAMSQLKAATARNFSIGLLLVGLALAGMVPISGRLVRDVRKLEEGAARLADGDLEARVEIRSRDELGRLATAFNHMAGQISENQKKLVEQERLRKEEEIARRLLAAENERRRHELEEAREFQLSLLPRELPRRADLELAVSMTTATEVGGDYYDFLEPAGGALVLAVGDATGHGAAAGTMVTAVKGLFTGGAAAVRPAEFLRVTNGAIHRMGLVRRAMALVVGRLEGRRLVLSAAGMPPVLRFSAATGEVEEIALAGTPLGARAEFPYEEAAIELAADDVLLLVSDGLPELPNAAGEPFGYERLSRRFVELARGDAASIVAGLEASARDWSGGSPPADDITYLVLRAR